MLYVIPTSVGPLWDSECALLEKQRSIIAASLAAITHCRAQGLYGLTHDKRKGLLGLKLSTSRALAQFGQKTYIITLVHNFLVGPIFFIEYILMYDLIMGKELFILSRENSRKVLNFESAFASATTLLPEFSKNPLLILNVAFSSSKYIAIEPYNLEVLALLTALKMELISNVFIAVLGFSSAFAHLADEDYGEKYFALTRQLHDKCTLITGTTQTSIDAVKYGNFLDTDEKMKRYILCIWLLSDSLTSNFSYNTDMMTEYMPKKIKNGIKIYDECLECAKKSDAVEAHERIWVMTKCIQKANPETFIMF
ncbi:hypothetical protein JTB14_024201 [Gonioctena quinquepunctata]|nr:hypothetical protein JTB14_024201 [Gonioctena quinquepunctata]